MLTAWGPAGQSARFCGEYVEYPQQAQRNAQRLGNLLFPHQPHPLSGGVANRLYVTAHTSVPPTGGFFIIRDALRFVKYCWFFLQPRFQTALER